MTEEVIAELEALKERLLRLREEKACLLGMLENIEEDAENEADVLEKEITELQSQLEAKKKPREQEIVFSF